MKTKRAKPPSSDQGGQSFFTSSVVTSLPPETAEKAIANIDRILKKPPRIRRSPTGDCCGETTPCKRWRECYDCSICKNSMDRSERMEEE